MDRWILLMVSEVSISHGREDMMELGTHMWHVGSREKIPTGPLPTGQWPPTFRVSVHSLVNPYSFTDTLRSVL